MRKPWYHILYTRSALAKIIWGTIGVMLAVVLTVYQFSIEDQRMVAQTGNWEGRSIEKGAEIFTNNCYSCHGLNGEGGSGPALNSKYLFTQRLYDIGFNGTLRDYVALTVASGRPSRVNGQFLVIMPPWSNRFGGPLRDDQVEHVVNYVMNFQETALAQTAEEDPWICFQGAPTKPQPEAEKSPEALGIKVCEDAAASTGPRTPQVLFTAMTCNTCHKLDQEQTADNQGVPGPNLGNLPATAGDRVEGQDAATYVHTSIVDPNAFVNPGYLTGLMPQTFQDQMSEEEINSLVAWLLDPDRPQ
jgi:mono/diheme cytochrome c family protein